MSGEGVAYRTSAHDVMDAWDAYKAVQEEARERRRLMEQRYGRRLMVLRGWGHSVDVVGFEVFDGEEDGTILGEDGALRIPKVGPPYNTATPNLRRKAGKDLAAELRTLRTASIDLPGMPSFELVGSRMLSPALFEHDAALYARWSGDVRGVDESLWEPLPLSAYYAAHEAHAEREAGA